jgi:hypothetical protein
MAKALGSALSSQDPYRIAAALRIAFSSTFRKEDSIKKHNERLTLGATDWAPVVNSYLDASDAAKVGRH